MIVHPEAKISAVAFELHQRILNKDDIDPKEVEKFLHTLEQLCVNSANNFKFANKLTYVKTSSLIHFLKERQVNIPSRLLSIEEVADRLISELKWHQKSRNCLRKRSNQTFT